MLYFIFKCLLSGLIIAVVSEVADEVQLSVHSLSHCPWYPVGHTLALARHPHHSAVPRQPRGPSPDLGSVFNGTVNCRGKRSRSATDVISGS
jgi:hypothetical protein